MTGSAHQSHAFPRVFRHDSTGPAPGPVRLALYSHDAMGIGHVRRNVLIAQALSEAPVRATSLLFCGVHEAASFTGGNGMDCLTLPTLTKHGNDDYRPRDLRLSRETVSAIRTATLDSTLLAFEPDVLLVDKVPQGLDGELTRVISKLRRRGRTRVVFGMREVLDTPQSVKEEWRRKQYTSYIRQNYDAVWVYGDPNIYDSVAEYGLDELGDLVLHTGYFDQRERLRFALPLDPAVRATLDGQHRTVLCMVGGGQDGYRLAQSFVTATLPDGYSGLLITGPLMPAADRQTLSRLVASRSDMTVLNHVREADLLMDRVDRVICMGGYNSLLSVVSFEKPALIVPRVEPRREQLIRAQRFAEHGMVAWLSPDHLSARAISQWLASPASHARPDRSRVNLGGLSLISRCVNEWTNSNSDCLTNRATALMKQELHP